MIQCETELLFSLAQMGRVLRALDGLRDTVLPRNPQLFSVMAEGYIDQVNEIREEVAEYVRATHS